MKCPKCGYQRQPDHLTLTPPTECPACGIIFAKFESLEPTDPEAVPEKSFVSPVDERSLRQARERVEMRLRKNASAQRAGHQNRTLELAKQLAIEGVRRRREEWERSRGNAETGEAPQGSAVAQSAVQEQLADTVADGIETISQTNGPELQQQCDEVPEPPLIIASPMHIPSTPLSRSRTTCTRNARSIHRRPARNGGQRLWSVTAFFVLAVGLVGAVLSWTTIDYVGSGMPAGTLSGSGPPLALLLGFAYLYTGLLGFAFFWVAGMLNGRFSEIRRMLLEQQCLPDEVPTE